MAKGPSKRFIFTPVGTAEPYCSLQKPDYGNEERGFGNPRGEWKVNLTIPKAECRGLIKEIMDVYNANWDAVQEAWQNGGEAEARSKLQRGKKLLEPYKGDLPFFENDDGTVTFKFKAYASFIDKNTKESKPIDMRVVDTKGKRIEAVPAIAGGSRLKCRFSMFAYPFNATVGASVKLQLDSVMLVELKEFVAGGNDWAEETTDGYVAGDDREQGWREEDQNDQDGEGYSSDDHGDF